MERVIKQNRYSDIACNDTIIYSNSNYLVERNINDTILEWKIIKPKYYKYKDDDVLLEIWDDDKHNEKGIVLDRGNNKYLRVGYISDSWTEEYREKIDYKQAMKILKTKQDKSYNNKDLMSKDKDELRGYKEQPLLSNEETNELLDITDKAVDKLKQNNNGGASDWYSLPEKATTLQDLIEHRNMNGSVKDIFKACYRLGIKTEDELRDLNKMAYYSLREIGRISGRKDYITIAKELMGSQAIKEYYTCKECDGKCNGDCMI